MHARDTERQAFEGRVAVVTGASRGIGRAISLALARSGASVHSVARDRLALEAMATEQHGIIAQPTDIQDDEALEALHVCLDAAAPGPDLLVHCAGVIAHAPIRDADPADLDAMFAVNLRAAYRLTQGLLPKLIANQGDVAFVNSSVTQFPRAHSGQFAATQHALVGFANSLREEVNPMGVRVLTLYPGKTATPRQERLHASSADDYRPSLMLQPDDVAAALVGALSLPRRAEITEIRIRPTAKS